MQFTEKKLHEAHTHKSDCENLEWSIGTDCTPTAETVESKLIHKSTSVRENSEPIQSYTHTSEHMNDALEDQNEYVEEVCTGRKPWSPTPEIIERGLTDHYTPEPKHIERGLTDPYWEVREAWAMRIDFNPTPEQIERGLTDVDTWVRAAWAERMDFTPTPEQIERALTDKERKVRCSWVRRMDWTPTMEQAERGILEQDMDLLLDWLKRTDVIWSETHIQAGLLHSHASVRKAWEQVANRQNAWDTEPSAVETFQML